MFRVIIAFWDGESRGTRHMIDIMIKANKPYRIIQIKKGGILNASLLFMLLHKLCNNHHLLYYVT